MQRIRQEQSVLRGYLFVKLWLIGALPAVLACAQELPPANRTASNPDLTSIVEHMQTAQAETRISPSYQVVRKYRLSGEKSSSPSSEVWAEVDYLPPNHKAYVIEKRTGSSRGELVVRRILERESQMTAGSSVAALDNNNYVFGYLGEASLDGTLCYLLSLTPKRSQVELVHGKAWVDQQSFRVRRIEGQMAKTPSWLLKKVDLRIDFSEVAGTWLQTSMEAIADVRFVGGQTLKSETVDARVGNLVTQKTPPPARGRGKSNRNQVPATVIAPDPM
jgi:hypothetical protein